MEGTGRGRLLLVEDEGILRRLIADFLRGEGFDVTEAGDGSEGASLYAGLGPFDLVLLDLNLPLLSGVDVCRRIKAMRPAQPVLICSAAILDWHVVALKDLQVDQFLSKPYHPLDLLERIRRELARPSRGRDAAVAGAARGTGRPSARGALGPVQAAAGGIKYRFGPVRTPSDVSADGAAGAAPGLFRIASCTKDRLNGWETAESPGTAAAEGGRRTPRPDGRRDRRGRRGSRRGRGRRT